MGSYILTCKKRIVAIIMAMSLVISLGTPVQKAYAESASGDWTYTVLNNTAIITGHNSPDAIARLEIPESLDGYPVSGISSIEFRDLPNLTEIVIPDSLKMIDANTFNGCSLLTTLTYSADCSLETIGLGAFLGTGFTALNLPVSVKTIESEAFAECASLQTVAFSDASVLETIGERVFYSCEKLEEVTLGAASSLQSVGEEAFMGCKSLSTVSISATSSLKSIGAYVFYETALANITLPNSLETIGSMAFNKAGFTEVTIPASVTEIGSSAFSECASLKDLSFASNSKLQTIGYNAFLLTGITSVALPDTVEVIGDSAFNSCYNLETITIGTDSQLKEIGEMAFRYTEIGAVHLPDKLEKIGASAFIGTKISAIEIPTSLTAIGNSAFEGTELVSVYIPDTVETMGTSVFDLCSSMEELIYPARFRENVGTPPSSTTMISYTINEGTTPTVSLQYDQLFENTIIPDTFLGMEVVSANLGNGDIPSQIMVGNDIKTTSNDILPVGWSIVSKDIGINIPAGGSVTIEAYSLLSSQASTTATFTVIISREPCTNTELRNVKVATCKEDGYTGDICCTDCDDILESGSVIPKSNEHTWDNGKVTKEPTATQTGVKTYTCSCCGQTKTEKIEALGTTDKGNVIKDKNSKSSYKVIKSGAVQYVGTTDKRVKKIVIPNTVKVDGVTYKVVSIATNAFSGCKKLKTVTIGANVTTIGDKAFYKCTALAKITIPSKVTKIGKQAFYGCKKLKNIIIKSKKLKKNKIGKNAFKGIKKKATIKVPKKKMKLYKKMLKKSGVSSKARYKKL